MKNLEKLEEFANSLPLYLLFLPFQLSKIDFLLLPLVALVGIRTTMTQKWYHILLRQVIFCCLNSEIHVMFKQTFSKNPFISRIIKSVAYQLFSRPLLKVIGIRVGVL